MVKTKYLIGTISVEDATEAAQKRGAVASAYYAVDDGIKTGMSRKERRRQAALERKEKTNAGR